MVTLSFFFVVFDLQISHCGWYSQHIDFVLVNSNEKIRNQRSKTTCFKGIIIIFTLKLSIFAIYILILSRGNERGHTLLFNHLKFDHCQSYIRHECSKSRTCSCNKKGEYQENQITHRVYVSDISFAHQGDNTVYMVQPTLLVPIFNSTQPKLRKLLIDMMEEMLKCWLYLLL